MKFPAIIAGLGSDKVIAVALAALFFAVYFTIGLPIVGPLVSHHLTVAGADSEAVIALLTKYEGFNFKTGRHPLFLILLNPIGWSLAKVIGSALAALLLNVTCGALLVALLFMLLRKVGASTIDATLFAVLLGMAASQLVLASIPETFIFTALAILTLISIHVFCDEEKTFLLWFLPCSVIAFGMAVTSLAPVTIILFFRYRTTLLWKRLAMLGGVNIGIVIVTTVLALLQEAIYPGTNFFLSRQPYDLATLFLTFNLFTQPITHLREFGPELFINTIIAKRGVGLGVINFAGYYAGDHLEMFFHDTPASSLRTAAVIGLALISSLAVILILYRKLYTDTVVLIVGSYTAFDALFQLLYDPYEIFVLSPLFVFAWVALIAMAFVGLSKRLNIAIRSLLIVTMLLIAINNVQFVQTLLEQLESWLLANPTL